MVPLSKQTSAALEGLQLSMKDVERTKNFFALGLMYWLFDRPLEPTLTWIEKKFGKKQIYLEANQKALTAGYYYGENTEIFTTRYHVKPAKLEKGSYRSISGNEAVALGFVSASVKAGIPLFLGSYPITPASEILQELSNFKNFGVKTFQAEDEIAGIASAIGASFAGNLAVTTTSGPGLALKSEAIGLAVMTELPLVIVDVQRGGPSTGLPTKTEQSDLLQAMYGRNGESPVPVIAASTPSDCFDMAFEACRIAVKYMTPVFLLSEGYLANGSEPWKIPDVDSLPEIPVNYWKDKETYNIYARDENLSRPWAIPGTAGLEHRIGGLEKAHIYGTVSYVPENHEFMVRMRDAKVKKIQDDIPDLVVMGDEDADLLVAGWGGTYGSVTEAIANLRKKGHKIAQVHFKYINPFPKNTKEILSKYKQILMPERNLGQLSKLLKAEFLVEVIEFNKIQGSPFKSSEIENKIISLFGGENVN